MLRSSGGKDNCIPTWIDLEYRGKGKDTSRFLLCRGDHIQANSNSEASTPGLVVIDKATKILYRLHIYIILQIDNFKSVYIILYNKNGGYYISYFSV